MKIEIRTDEAYSEPKIIILTAAVTDEVSRILKKLGEEAPPNLSGIRNEKLELLEPSELIRIYASGGKVFAVSEKGEYSVRLRLYEVEERLDRTRFVRISNSEIINLKKAESFDLSLTGTICVRLSDGTTAYVSRRYVSKIKQILGV